MENISNTFITCKDTLAIEKLMGVYDSESNIIVYSFLALIILLAFLALCLFRSSWCRWIFSHLKWIAISVFVVGILLYMVGFNHEGSENNILVLFLRSCISSLEMFVSESDLIEVKCTLKDSPLYMTIFSITHFMAVFVSAIFILRLFGLRLMSMCRLWLRSLFCKDYNLYVFWGINKKAMTVAESILNDAKSDDKGKKAYLVFVKMGDCGKHHSSRFTFSHFFHTIDDGIEEYVDRIERLNSGNVKTFLTVTDRLIDMEFVKNYDGCDIFEKIGLKNLRRCMCRSHKTEFFVLSEDEHRNVETVCAMMNLMDTCDYKVSSIYCHGRENRINRSLLETCKACNNIYLIDSSMLAVLQIKKYADSQPVNFVECDNVTGTVSSVFTAMVIGFGETGRDVFRFLYEFGSFVKETKKGADGKDNIIEQDKKIYVVDKHLGELKTKFLVNAPALRNNGSIQWLDDISTYDMQFWDKMKKIVNQLNYVVVAVDNDEEAAFIAVQIFEFAHCYRRNLDRFKIYVRMRDENRKRLLEQINKYRITIGGKEIKIIEAFGTEEKVFAYENLSEESTEENVENFRRKYDIIYNAISKGLQQDTEIEKLDAVGKSFKDYYQHEQNRSNVYHISTKLILAGVEKGNGSQDKLDHLISVTSRNECNEYPELTSETDKTLFNNLAYCEHLRWNAKMELLGFVHGEHKSMKHKTHDCFLSCNDLIRSDKSYVADTLRYDKGIVELSLKSLKDKTNDR